MAATATRRGTSRPCLRRSAIPPSWRSRSRTPDGSHLEPPDAEGRAGDRGAPGGGGPARVAPRGRHRDAVPAVPRQGLLDDRHRRTGRSDIHGAEAEGAGQPGERRAPDRVQAPGLRSLQDEGERDGQPRTIVEVREPGEAPMTPLTGLGVWIWEFGKCERGSVAVISAKAKACGVSHVIVKAGEERANGQVTPGLVAGRPARGGGGARGGASPPPHSPRGR